MYCTASMLPAGRYYYEPEAGYVGNPIVKFSLQFVYIYLGWLLHHLDVIDHKIYQFSHYFILRSKTSPYYLTYKGLYSQNFNSNSESSFEKKVNDAVDQAYEAFPRGFKMFTDEVVILLDNVLKPFIIKSIKDVRNTIENTYRNK